MFELIKFKLGLFYLRRKVKQEKRSEVNFGKFYSRSSSILVVLPSDIEDFKYLKEFLGYLWEDKKSATIIVKDHQYSNIANPSKFKTIGFNIKDVTKLNLPSKSFQNKLSEFKFDLVIDLNHELNLFYCAISNYVKSGFRICIFKDQTDLFYDIQLSLKNYDENSYRILLNSLKMF